MALARLGYGRCVLATGIVKGLAGGAVGTVAMTVVQVVEQRLTGRPDSYVPARAAEGLLGLRRRSVRRRRRLNLAAHWGTGIAVGAVRGIMGEAGLNGPWASAMHTVIRITTDETMHNASGVSTPPWTWPRRELLVDVGHKAVYALATGAAVDLLARPPHRKPARKARQLLAVRRV